MLFIHKTCSKKKLAKLINQGVAAALFSSRRLKNVENNNNNKNYSQLEPTRLSAWYKVYKKIENEKIVLCLEITEIYRGCQFWVGQNDSGHKNSFL